MSRFKSTSLAWHRVGRYAWKHTPDGYEVAPAADGAYAVRWCSTRADAIRACRELMRLDAEQEAREVAEEAAEQVRERRPRYLPRVRLRDI